MDMYMGSIMPWPIQYAPQGWLFCQGQTLQISQYSALYALLGTTFGGDARTTFCLPDLRGRVPIGAGQSQSSNYSIGQVGGTETVTLTAAQMPAHNHPIPASSDTAASTGVPGPDKYLALAQTPERTEITIYGSPASGTANTTIKPTNNNGGSQPHENRPPYLALNYIICVEGLFPPRP